MDNKPQEVIRVAQTLFHQNPDWVTFFREVLGLGRHCPADVPIGRSPDRVRKDRPSMAKFSRC